VTDHSVPLGTGDADDRGEAAHSAQLKNKVSQLFTEHNRLLLRFLEARLGDREEAKDVAQEAYARLLELQRPNTISFLRAYLFRIAANLTIDRGRSRSVRQRVETLELLSDESQGDSVERQACAVQDAARFWEVLSELPIHYRQAIVMSRLQDLSCEAIATRIGKTDRTVRRYIVYALAYCRQRLDGVAPEDMPGADFIDG
jgi:RNA polymerase sigma-70 factor (ECF subfamily)